MRERLPDVGWSLVRTPKVHVVYFEVPLLSEHFAAFEKQKAHPGFP